MKHLKFEPWEDPTCGGCQLAAMVRFGSTKGSLMSNTGCADHEEPAPPKKKARRR